MPKNTKKLTREMEEALQDNDNFMLFKAKIEKEDIKTAPLSLRMDFAIVGLQIGLTPETSLALSHVNQEELKQWMTDPVNKEAYDRAYLFCQAQLEFILFQTATRNAELALKLLERRDPSKWKASPGSKKPQKEEENLVPTVQTGLNFSEMLKSKQLMAGKEDFDVEFTSVKTA